MDAHRQREIARKGGRAAHEKGKAHEFTPDEARAAGRKGGEKVSVNRKHMAEIGRRGGRSSAQRRRPGGGEGAAGDNGSSNGNGNGMQEAVETVQQAQQEPVGATDREQGRQDNMERGGGESTQAG